MAREPFPVPIRTHVRFTRLLVATTLGAYVLLIAGATTSIADAAASCGGWPTCSAGVDPLADRQVAIAIGHRLAALVVGVLVAIVTATATLGETRRRVRLALWTCLALYPIQVGVGALAATNPGSAIVSPAHLVIGITIFGALVLALAWTLEATTAGEEGRQPVEPSAEPTDPEPEPARDLPENPIARAKLTAKEYVRMTKPRLMWLLCLVAAAGMALAAGPDLSGRTVTLTMLGGVLAIGASGTFNNVLERDVDRRMQRTEDRPVATELIPVRNALAFGVLLSVASVSAFLAINRLAALLGLAAILFYSVVYTLVLKPNTVQNTVIGGAAGAFPALIGWAAVTERIGLPALALAGVIFLWTPAHFYNLAIAYKEDYARGGFPMLPVVRGEAVARKHVLLYLGATLAAAAALSFVPTLGPLYAATSVLAGTVFLWAVVRLHRERTDGAALRSFHASNAYLGCLLVAVLVDALVL